MRDNLSPTDQKLRTAEAVLLVCAAALLIFLFLYRYDNQYTRTAIDTRDGAPVLSGPVFLRDGWEVSQTQAAGPDDITTYRRILPGSPGQGITALYLPKSLRAFRVYADGTLAGGEGHVASTPGRYTLHDNIILLNLTGDTELVIQTRNQSRHHGGLYDPPAIGSVEAVSRMIGIRIIFYGFLCFASLTLALYNLLLRLTEKGRSDPLTLSLGLLCMVFSLWAGISHMGIAYAVRDAAGLAALYFVVRMVVLLSHLEDEPWVKKGLMPLTLMLCAAGAVATPVLLSYVPSAAYACRMILIWYRLLTALLLIGLCWYGYFHGKRYLRTVLAGLSFYGCCLVFLILIPNRFKPVYGGWPEEYGVFLLVILFAVLMAVRSRDMVRENTRLAARLQEEVAQKTIQLTAVLNERKSFLAELTHDLKSPLTAVLNYSRLVRSNSVHLDADLQEKLSIIEEKCLDMTGRIKSLQDFTTEDEIPIRLEPLSLPHFLAEFYRANRPVIEMSGPNFHLYLPRSDCRVMADPMKLQRVLENLVYNAEGFTPPDGEISLRLEADEANAFIDVTDNGCGIPKENLNKIFNRFYTNRPDGDGQGLGLAISKSIILEHGGDISVESEVGKGSVFRIRLPLMTET